MTSDDPDDEKPSTRALDHGWLRALFLDLYGRPPREVERETWLGKAPAQLVDAALDDEESWRHWLEEQLAYFMLIDEFRPVGTSLDELPSRLAARTMTPRDALHRIALSTSFDQRNPGADTFVTVVMEQLCGLEVQRAERELEIGKSAYDGGTGVFLGSRATSQSDVVKIAVEHDKAADHLVRREFERLCHAGLARRDAGKAARRIEDEPAAMVSLYRDWFLSDAYAERVASGAPVSNRVWVRSVFVDLSEELPSADETEALRSALDGLGDPAPLRSAIVRMLLGSKATAAPSQAAIGDAGEWVVRTFERLLGRAPTSEERATFSEIAGSGSEGPELCLYALMTSGEYDRP